MSDNKKSDLPEWREYLSAGNYGSTNREKSLRKGLVEENGKAVVRGYYSEIELTPNIDKNHPLYPSHDHIRCDSDNGNMAIEAAIINRLKTDLPEEWFWKVIAHLFAVGLRKNQSGLKRGISLKNGSALNDANTASLILTKDDWNTLAEAVKRNRGAKHDFVRRLKYAIITYSGGQKVITDVNLEKAVAHVLKDTNSNKASELVKVIKDATDDRSEQGLSEVIDLMREEICKLAAIETNPAPPVSSEASGA